MCSLTRRIVARLADHMVTLQRPHSAQSLPAQRQNDIRRQADADIRFLAIVYWFLVPAAVRVLSLQYPVGGSSAIPGARRIRLEVLQRLHGERGAAQRAKVTAHILQRGEAARRSSHEVLQMAVPMVGDDAAQGQDYHGNGVWGWRMMGLSCGVE